MHVARADGRLRALVDRSHILVLASHNLRLLSSLCTRAIVLAGGRVAFDGPIEEAIERYKRAKSS